MEYEHTLTISEIKNMFTKEVCKLLIKKRYFIVQNTQKREAKNG